MKPALLVIDMQEIFFDHSPAVSDSLTSAVEYINAAIALFRDKDFPILVIEDVEEEDNRMPGSDGFETTSKIDLLPTDPRIHKNYGNAFNKTNLNQILQDLEIDTLFLTGFAASQCVLSTYRGATDLDYTPIIFRSSLADASQEHIRFVEDVHNLISYGALEKFFELL